MAQGTGSKCNIQGLSLEMGRSKEEIHKGMRVRWTKMLSASAAMRIYESYPEANACDFDIDYEGEVIGTTKSFWGATYLVVALDDGRIMEVDIDIAKQIGHGKTDNITKGKDSHGGD
jgi:hypothetical protein